MKVASGADVAGRLLEALRFGRGERVVCLGVTGSGKSYALRALGAVAAVMTDVVYVLDDTEDAHRWHGQRRLDLVDCHARPLVPRAEGGSHVVVLTGDVFRRIAPDPEAVAVDAWALAAKGYTCAIVLDELRRATSSPQRWAVPQSDGGELPRAFTEGRKAGISVLGATNFPQEVPREALGQSHLVIFRLEGGETSYLANKRLVSDELADEVARLPPRHFVVRWLGGLTDRTHYQF